MLKRPDVYTKFLFLPLVALLNFMSSPSLADAGWDVIDSGWGVIEVETRILNFDPQPGMKTTQTVWIDMKGGKIAAGNRYKTGTTDFFGINLPSMRDKFTSKDKDFSYDERVRHGYNWSIETVGETASGVGIVPNINYHLTIRIARSGDPKTLRPKYQFEVTGCHDGYPAYKVTFSYIGSDKRHVLYNFRHKSKDLLKLFGSCDIKVNETYNVPPVFHGG